MLEQSSGAQVDSPKATDEPTVGLWGRTASDPGAPSATAQAAPSPEPTGRTADAQPQDASPPFDATAGRSEGWLVVVEHGAPWPNCLVELLVATTVVLIVEQPGEARTELMRRIAASVHKFPDHSWDRTGLVIRNTESPGLHAEVILALQKAVGHRQPLLELAGDEPRLLVVAPPPEDEPSRTRLQRPCLPACECIDSGEEGDRDRHALDRAVAARGWRDR